MAFSSSIVMLALWLAIAAATARAQCTSGGVLVCLPTSTPPKLDGVLSDWAGVPAFTTPLFTYFETEYPDGPGTFKCVHDNQKVYFSMEVPGKYRFNATGGHQSPAVGTMTKVGTRASFINMGGCPAGLDTCNNSIPFPSSCDNYVVDIGAHWQTRVSKQGVEYQITLNGTGRDTASRKDDEYAVGPKCRRADDGPSAGNVWAGAWTHSDNSTTGADGFYRFELSRLLTTASALTDAQYVIGKNFSFGLGFWDPWETPTGYTAEGHYITGCGTSWITLALIPGDVTSPVAAPTSPPSVKPVAAPVNPPTNTPVVPPTNTPVPPPTNAPVPPPTSQPTNKPVTAPTSPPTNKPVSAPAPVPIQKPVQLPGTFTSKPVVVPTAASTKKPALQIVGSKKQKKVKKFTPV